MKFRALFLLQIIVTAGDGFLLGCYRENLSSREFKFNPGNYDLSRLVPGDCMKQCSAKRYKYVGLFAGRFCFCSQTLSLSKDVDGACTMDCSGKTGVKCGSLTHTSVYQVVTPIQGLSVTPSPAGYVKTFTQHTFTTSTVSADDITYQVDKGDGAGRGNWMTSTNFTRQFSIPGVYSVNVYAKDTNNTYTDVQAITGVSVQSPVGKADLICADVSVTYETMECNATVYTGTRMTVDIDYGDGTIETFPIADALIEGVGRAIPEDVPADNVAHAHYFRIMPSAEVRTDSYLSAFEYVAVGNGTVTFKILEPFCDVGQYCYTDNSCAGSCPELNTCTSNEVYCHKNDVCTASNLGGTCGGFTTNRYSASAAPVGYRVKHSIKHDICCTGFHVFQLNQSDSFLLSKGDIIGYEENGHVIAVQNVTLGNNTDFHAPVGQSVHGKDNFTASGTRSLIRAISSSASVVEFYHKYVSAGDYNISLNVRTELVQSSVNTNSSVQVLTGINDTTISGPEYVTVGDDVTFSLLPHTGEKITYTWNISGIINITNKPVLHHTFLVPGNYTVHVKAANLLTDRENSSYVIAQEAIRGMALFGSPVVGTHESNQTLLNMTSGSDFTCTWDFGDSTTKASDYISTPKTGGEMSHAYAAVGNYIIMVNCSNQVSNGSAKLSVSAVDRITIVKLDKEGAEAKQPFRIAFTFTGSNVSFALELNNTSYDVTYDEKLRSGSTDMISEVSGYGSLPLVINATNPLGSYVLETNFTIEGIITDVYVAIDTNITRVGGDITFSVRIGEGTSVCVSFDFGDTTQNKTCDAAGKSWEPPNSNMTRTHKYTIPGCYNASVVVNNAITTTTWVKQVCAVNDINELGIQLGSNAPVRYVNNVGRADVMFIFNASLPLPVLAIYSFSIDSVLIHDNIDYTGNIFPHEFKQRGRYSIAVTISNPISNVSLETIVEVLCPVENMQLNVDPPNSLPSQNVTMDLSMDCGDNVTLYWAFGDARNEVEQKAANANAITKTYAYAIGVYDIEVRAENPFGNTTKTHRLFTQEPVRNNFSVSHNAPVLGPEFFQMNLTYPGSFAVPTNATVSINWKHGAQEEQQLSFDSPNPNYVMKMSKNYSVGGDYWSDVIIENKVSMINFTVNSAVYFMFCDKLVVNVQTPLEGTTDEFSNEHDVTISAEVNCGGPVKSINMVAESITDGDIHYCESKTNQLSYRFPNPGEYILTVTGSNPFDSLETNDTTILVVEGISGLKLTDQGEIAKPNTEKTVHVSLYSVGPNPCIRIEWGDGRCTSYGFDSTECGKTNLNGKCSYQGNVTKTIDATHVYSREGFYEVNGLGWSVGKASNMTTQSSLLFIISSLNCNKPSLDIKDSTKYTVTNPRGIIKKDAFTVEGELSLKCRETSENLKSWTLTKYFNGTYNDTTYLIKDLVSKNSAILVVPAGTLEYGIYKFDLTVRMAGRASIFWDKTSTYIEIKESPLVVGLLDGAPSLVYRGFGEPLVFDARAHSYDPDDLTETTGSLRYEFYCKRFNETITLAEMVNSSAASSPYTLGELNSTIADQGGCFRKGPGRLNISGSEGGNLAFDTSTMVINLTYQICVVAKKDTRERYSCVNVKLVEGNPPSVRINCGAGGLCTRNRCGQRINPANRLALVGGCESNCINANAYNYKWDLSYQSDKIWIQLNLTDYSPASSESSIVIDAKLFQRYKNHTRFRLGLKMSRVGQKPGLTFLTLCVNQPPVNGSCIISGPPENATLNGKWDITCSDWKDPEGDDIVEYKVFVRHSQTTPDIQVMFSSSPNISLSLPLGLAENSYTMDVIATISDVHGAVTTFTIGQVQVKPAPLAEVRDVVKTILSNEASELTNILNSGNIKETSNAILPIISQMNTIGNTKPTSVQREEDAKVRRVFVDSLDDLTKSVSNIADIAQVSTALKGVIENTDEVSRDGQIKSTQGVTRMVDMVSNLSETTSVEELEKQAQTIVSLIGDITEAVNIHMTNPLNFDIQSVVDKQYYDTDIDTEDAWLQGSPDEASSELLLETNTKEQRTTASSVVQEAKMALQKLSLAIARNKFASEKATVIQTDNMDIYIDKSKASSVTEQTYDIGDAFVNMSSIDLCATSSCYGNETVTMIASVDKSPPYSFIKNSDVSRDSQAVTIDFFTLNETSISIENTNREIEIQIPRNQKIPFEPVTYIVDPVMANNSWTHLAYHKFYANKTNSSVHIQVYPEDTNAHVLVLVRRMQNLSDNNYPNLTTGDYNYIFVLPMDEKKLEQGQDRHTAFIENIGSNTGLYRIGVRQLSFDERAMYESITPGTKLNNIESFAGRFTTNYSIRTYSTGCYFEQNLRWETYGTRVGALTTTNFTQCFSNHLTTFAGGWIVQPNPIDFNYVFNNMSLEDNPTIYATIGVIFAIYIAVAIWARHKDKKDLERIGVSPLPDNDPNDKYLYEVLVFTGLRKNAGTDSKVHVIFSGEEVETDVRVLEDPKRKVLRRGGVDSFLMAVSRPMGDLNYARVWHDNSGKGKFGSWYLKYIMVVDLQTKRRYFFISNEWFAVEEGDGQVDRLLPVAGKEQMTAFGHLFTKTSQKNMGDGHLWFSVIARPPKSRFTRLQRVSCCLSLLFLSMVTNAMFYGLADSPSGSLQFGPFSLSPEQISIGVMTNLIVFPVNLLLVTLFRKSRPRRKRPSRIAEAMKYNSVANSLVELSPKKIDSRPTTSSTDTEISMPDKSTLNKDKKKKFELPWWCLIPAWIILWISVLASGLFVLFYSIQWGDEKVRGWITSMVITFFTSIFLTQPIKVILFAAFIALVVKKPSTDEEDEGEEDEEEPQLEADEMWLHKKDPSYGAAKPRKIAYKPPDPSVLEAARERRLKELKMFDIIREIIFYVMFLWLLIVVSYSNRDPYAHGMKKGLEKFFVKPKDHPTAQYKQVIKTETYWHWMKTVLIPGIRASRWYNNDQPLFQRGYFDDRVSRVMGFVTIRQLRIRNDSCKVTSLLSQTHLNLNCYEPYSMDKEDRGQFSNGWTPTNNNAAAKSEYTYRTADELEGYPYAGDLGLYSGGGYVIKLRGKESLMLKKIEQLETEPWIDRFTRAVFVEFTVYNAYVNLFGVATMLAEFPESGGVLTSYRFEPVRLLNYIGSAMLFQIVCEVAFVAFAVFFLVKEIRNLMEQRKSYFGYFWNWVEMMIVVFSFISIGIYIYRIVVADELTTRFKVTNGNSYMKFQYIGTWNELLTYFMGILVFLATLKFIKLFRFNKRMSLIGSTLSHASRSLWLFLIMFSIIFLAFIQLFYFLLSSHLLDYSTFMRCLESCIVIILGKFSFYELRQTSDLAVAFFFLYMVTVVMILVNMLLSILMESFTAVKSDLSKQSNDYEMVDFLLSSFKTWTGVGGGDGKEKEIPSEMNLTQDPNDPVFIQRQVDNFPYKVERLLESISKVYFEKDKSDSLFRGLRKDLVHFEESKVGKRGNDTFIKQASQVPVKVNPRSKTKKTKDMFISL